MKTTLPLLAICLCFLGLMGTAHAKPKIAVLGLEVIDNGGVDREATEAAQNLANELRGEAGRNGSKYQLAPNSAKNLLELKLLSNCSDEGRSCMAEIGTDLGADRLLYGKLERRKNGYQISLKLLNTNTRQMEKTTSELVPRADLRTKKIGRWSRSLYARLIGTPVSGSLSVTANISKATIYVDGKVATTLRDGAAKVLGLSEGTHQITIEASGYEPYRADVAITAGASENLSISLRSTDAAESKSSTSGWKVAFVGGAIVTAGFLGGSIYSGIRVNGEFDEAKVDAWTALQEQDLPAYNMITGDTAQGQDVADSCGKAERVVGTPSPSLLAFISACRDGEDAATLTNIFLAGTVMAAAATAYFGYQGWLADKSSKERPQARRETNRVIVTPQIGPDSLGAGLSIEF